MLGMTDVAISKREASILRSRGKANELCSLLCAYRLLDIVASQELTEGCDITPLHLKMGVNVSKNEVRT